MTAGLPNAPRLPVHGADFQARRERLYRRVGSGYYRTVAKSKTDAGMYSSTFQANNGTFAQSMRMSLPAELVRSLQLVKGMTAYIRENTDGSFTVYPNKPPDHRGKRG
jgi:hypothetical protein